MSVEKKNFNCELAAHNVATVLTQASIEKEHADNMNKHDSGTKKLDGYARQYVLYYKKFYTEALNHFMYDLNDDDE